MQALLAISLLAFAGYARRVQESITQQESFTKRSLAEMLLAVPARMPLARKNARANDANMISADHLTVHENVVQWSWSEDEIGTGDVGTQLGKLTGPCVRKLDHMTRQVISEHNDNFDKFIAAAQSQGVMDMLKGREPITLLVPVDSSIKKNVDAKAHVLKGKYTLEDLGKGGTAQTLAGTTVEFKKPLRTVKVGDAEVRGNFNPADHRGGKEGTAFPFDVECTNGIIHAINEPLVATDAPLDYTPSAPAGAGAALSSFSTSQLQQELASRGASSTAKAAASSGGALPKKGTWDIATKKLYFDAWDPEKPRDYYNFNPFERNDENGLCDMNGCFPGQSRGYRSPTRPDMHWEAVQQEAKDLEELKKDPKFHITGKPGNFHQDWQESLGRPPLP